MTIGDALGKAFRYSASLDKMLPFFVLNLIFVIIGFAFLDSLLTALPTITTRAPASFISLAISVIVLLLIFALIWLVTLFLQGAVIDNASKYKGKDEKLSKSFPIVKGNYLSMLGAVILAGLISAILGSIPFIGVIISLVLSWMFLFVLQFVIVKDADAVSSLKQSYRFFMDNKLDVFLFWLVIMIIASILFYASLIPIFAAAWPVLSSLIAIALSGTTPNLTVILSYVQANMILIFITSTISAFLLSYVFVFQQAASTFFFVDTQKRGKKK